MKWTQKDLQTLIQHYPSVGAKGVQPMLDAHRKLGAIGQKARILGVKMCRADGGQREYQNYEMTPAILRDLRAFYKQNSLTGKAKTLEDIAKAHRVSLGWLKYQSGRYGLRRGTKRQEWAPEAEEAIIELEGVGVAAAHKQMRIMGYHYTLQQVASKMRGMGLSTTCETGMVANQVSMLFGVDSHAVLRWIRTGALKTQKIKNARGGDFENHFVPYRAIRDFVLRYKAEVDLRRIDPAYQDLFIDIMAGDLSRSRGAAA